MRYITIVPTTELDPFVRCYWTLNASKEIQQEKQRIVPDGCMEMIFHCKDIYRQYLQDGGYILQPRCFVFGQVTRPLEIAPTGETSIFAVRFHPNGFLPFATMAIAEMENKAVPLEELFGKDGLELGKSVVTAATSQDRIKVIESFLTDRLIRPEFLDRTIKSCVELMLTLNGQLSVTEVSEITGISRRHLERRFAAVIGLSPKQLSKIIRLQAGMKTLLNEEGASLTSLAYEGGYFDQAHFIRDFKEFTGVSPKKIYASHLKMSSLFSGTE